jgi:hypothetical protein
MTYGTYDNATQFPKWKNVIFVVKRKHEGKADESFGVFFSVGRTKYTNL